MQLPLKHILKNTCHNSYTEHIEELAVKKTIAAHGASCPSVGRQDWRCKEIHQFVYKILPCKYKAIGYHVVISQLYTKLGQIQLGHKNIKTTLTNYTGPNEKDKQHIDTILNPERPISPRDIAEELSRKYIVGQIPEKEYIYAIKNLRKSQTHHPKGPAIQ